MIEDISQDHPDRMRIVIAVNAGQCPNCDALFRPQTARRYEPKHFLQACDQGFNVAPDPPKAYFVQRIGRRTRA